MKKIKYFVEFLIIIFLLVIFKILGFKLASKSWWINWKIGWSTF